MMLGMEGADEMTLVSFVLENTISKIKKTYCNLLSALLFLNANYTKKNFEVVNKDYWVLQENTVSVFYFKISF